MIKGYTWNDWKTLALMKAASFCVVQRSKRYSGQQEKAPKSKQLKKVTDCFAVLAMTVFAPVAKRS